MSEHPPTISGEMAHERIMVKTGVVWAAAIGLATLVVVSMGLMWVFLLALNDGTPRAPSLESRQQLSLIKQAAPLDVQQLQQRLVYDRQQNEILNSYSWVDQKQHLARIPIERAMELVVEEYQKSK